MLERAVKNCGRNELPYGRPFNMVGSTRITVVSEGVAARRSSAIEQKDGAHRKRAGEKRGDTPPRFASGDGAAATAAPADWILHCVTQQPTKRRSAKSPAIEAPNGSGTTFGTAWRFKQDLNY